MASGKTAAGGDPANEIEEKRLKPASENPWYVLATACGKTEPDAQPVRSTTDKNRRIWNGWVCRHLTSDEKKRLVEKMGVASRDLKPLSNEEKQLLVRAFKRRLDCSLEIFDSLPNVDFSETEFANEVSFAGYIFLEPTIFDAAVFKETAFFEAAIFCEPVSCLSTAFGPFADFYSANFESYADFRSATFVSDANFQSAKFRQVADFEDATFNARANFRSADFIGVATFLDSKFKGNARFEYSTFGTISNFQRAIFLKEINFTGAKLNSTTYFRGARFVNEVPKFFESYIHQDTDWSASSWPAATKNGAGEAIRAYERLKLEMSAQHRHEDELNFLAREQKARAARDGFWHSLPNHIYRVLGDYGRSIGRPAGWLLALWFVCLVPSVPFGSDGEQIVPFRTAAGLSAGNIVGFTSINRVFAGPDLLVNLPYLVKVLYSLETILGSILIFLMLLALRNRFRIK